MANLLQNSDEKVICFLRRTSVIAIIIHLFLITKLESKFIVHPSNYWVGNHYAYHTKLKGFQIDSY